ncbi:MAG: methyltransferase domain-containing protein [Deltaproteobacteria bacterium]|nr:methyltransferase domain-containing protein [Deltaproteobacteria bacterium]MBW2396780.1 methyltransferase domain-containing protein [Deltaproteobacteria bacterium]
MRKGARIVRQGQRRVLRIDDTFASTYEPGRVTTGSVWDAIACGVLAVPLKRRRRVLLLGLGGGSAARIVRALAPKAVIVGVELSADVVRLAQEHLDLDALGLEVRIGDAREVVRSERAHYDVVLEDVFVGSGRNAYKPDGLPLPLLEQAKTLLRPGGVIVSNALDEAAEVRKAMAGLFSSVVEVGLVDFDNRIYVGSDAGLTAGSLRRAVAEDAVLGETLSQLHFRSR